jgi:hypothetical protein
LARDWRALSPFAAGPFATMVVFGVFCAIVHVLLITIMMIVSFW